MRIEEIWWKRLTNPSNFAQEITDSVLDGKSAVVLYQRDIAWKDELIGNIVEDIEKDSPNMKTSIHVPESDREPDEYIIQKYCSDEEGSRYWPSAENTVASISYRNIAAMRKEAVTGRRRKTPLLNSLRAIQKPPLTKVMSFLIYRIVICRKDG